jgi:hypothetical protein
MPYSVYVADSIAFGLCVKKECTNAARLLDSLHLLTFHVFVLKGKSQAGDCINAVRSPIPAAERCSSKQQATENKHVLRSYNLFADRSCFSFV